MVLYYTVGIFRREKKPVKKTPTNKFNPLQKWVYLGLKILVIPVLVTSGFLYYYFKDFQGTESFDLALIAHIHTLSAFCLMAFMFVHVYLTTTGHTPLSNIKAMITGWEELDVD